MSSPDIFDPPGVTWTRVSGRLATLRQVVLLVTCAVLVVVVAVLALTLASWVWLLGLPPVVLAVTGYAGIARNVAAWGYAERDDDLLIRRGVLFRSLVVVPYGRMQFVDVQAGPLDRAFTLARVQLHTASAATDAQIPGLPPDEASRLRDRLASRGEARLAGL